MVDVDGLNGPQREAVLATEGPLLVLAGAGSGKTKVLTTRIAHLIEDCGVYPWNILAITFTNKAAAEMRERIARMVGSYARGMWVSTFHSMCVRILRANAALVGRNENFTIYDDVDSKHIMKDIYAELHINEKLFPQNMVRNFISKAKNDLVSPEDYALLASDPRARVAAQVYDRLQTRLAAANAFDFDDLLMFTYILFRDNPDVLQAYQERFLYILVDEYQDTNKAQYAITTLLAQKNRNLMVVGDDDQSIYSWRGADISNILGFEHDYPEAHVVKLEQNYRSKGNILAAANAVIAHNTQRKAKTLFTLSDAGEKVAIYGAADERDEGRWIAGEIEKAHSKGMAYADCAVLYRTNAQSRILEDMFIRAGIPYRIVGGVRFFERAEIKDVMAYLTLVVNPCDDVAAKRVINTPRRGIGDMTVNAIDALRSAVVPTFMQAAALYLNDPYVRTSTRRNVASFLDVFASSREAFKTGDDSAITGENLRPFIESIIEKSGLIQALETENTEEARGRIENIKEFLGVVQEFIDGHLPEAEAVAEQAGVAAGATDAMAATGAEGAAGTTDTAGGEGLALFAEETQPVRVDLPSFLEWVHLRTDLDAVSENIDAAMLMTIHAAKGLEYPLVFVAGMEDGIFPNRTRLNEESDMQEERRLAYVAITRAKEKLYLTYAQSRMIYGQTQSYPVSPFLAEVPPELCQMVGLGSFGYSGTGWEKRGSRNGISGSGTEAGGGRVFGKSSTGSSFGARENATQRLMPDVGVKAAAKITFAKGDVIEHKVFGRGVVTAVKGDILDIRFDKTGITKSLMKDYAPIQKIG